MDLPDAQDPPPPVILLGVKKSSSPAPDIQDSGIQTLDDINKLNNDHHGHILSQLNERLRKTLSLDSRRLNSVQTQDRPKSMVHNSCHTTPNAGRTKHVKIEDEPSKQKSTKKKRFRPKSFFSLETFLDSRRSDASSKDDFSSSKYCKFYLDSAESSPIFQGRNTPDLLDTPGISTGESTCKKRLDKLENHFNKIQKLKGAQLNDKYERNESFCHEDDLGAIYSEPLYSSQSTLVLGVNNEDKDKVKRESSYNCIDYCGVGFRDHLEDLNNSSFETPEANAESSCVNNGEYEILIKKNDVLINDRTKKLVVKTMDKSVDSIGSCSLDVDADNTDFSDTTSGSLNILTPSSTASHFKDFTSRLQERVGPGFQRQDLRTLNEETHDHLLIPSPQRKKPSYLHLACSVNGYSNITTYDSKLRQKLNKSREASPGRIGNTADMLRECTDDAMATRLNSTNSNYFKTSFSETSISSNVVTYSKSNGAQNMTETHTSRSFNLIANGTSDASPSKSFIQQRVERLYGPGALAQGFFNQKRQKTKSQSEDEKVNGDKVMSAKSPENVHQVSRMHLLKRTPNGTVTERVVVESYSNGESSDPPLPVLRHLTPEFRAQLPILSPKRSVPFKINESFNTSSDSETSQLNNSNSRLSGFDVVDRGLGLSRGEIRVVSPLAREIVKSSPQITIVPIEREEDIDSTKKNISVNGVVANLDKKFVDLDISAPHIEVIKENGKVNGENNVRVENVLPSLDDNCNQVCNKTEPPSNNLDNGITDRKVDSEIVDLTTNNSIKVCDTDNLLLQGASSSNEELDGHYFLELKRKETERLIQLAETAERDLEELQGRGDASEEVLGFLRAAAGKARLLATQKMQQFEGLCHNNINCRADEPFPTTCTDLRGFWDMVSLQLAHVSQLFMQLQEMRLMGWKEVPAVVQMTEPSTRPTTRGSQAPKIKKVTVSKPTVDPARMLAAAKKREEQRKALMMARRNKVKAEEADAGVEIYAPLPRNDNSSEPTMTS